MKSLLVTLIMFFYAMPVMADLLTVTWVAPTQREDGTALASTEIKGYRLSWDNKGVVQPDKIIPAGTSYVLDTGLLTGKTCVSLKTIDTNNLESTTASTVACKNARPKQPTGVTIN